MYKTVVNYIVEKVEIIYEYGKIIILFQNMSLNLLHFKKQPFESYFKGTKTRIRSNLIISLKMSQNSVLYYI